MNEFQKFLNESLLNQAKEVIQNGKKLCEDKNLRLEIDDYKIEKMYNCITLTGSFQLYDGDHLFIESCGPMIGLGFNYDFKNEDYQLYYESAIYKKIIEQLKKRILQN